jgi:hypothetical protein
MCVQLAVMTEYLSYEYWILVSLGKHVKLSCGMRSSRISRSVECMSVATFRDNLTVPYSRVKESKTIEDGTDWLSRNVGKKLPLYAA